MKCDLIQPFMVRDRSICELLGIELRPEHHSWVLENRPNVAWLEVPAESFMTGGPLLQELQRVACHYPLSLHSVGLALSSSGLPDSRRLHQLCELVTRFEPERVSDHLSWSAVPKSSVRDRSPLPYTDEALRVVIRKIHHIQDTLKREILLENDATYVSAADSALSEADFLSEVVLRTGCGIVLNIDNLCLSAIKRGVAPAIALADFVCTLSAESFHEIRLTSHAEVWQHYRAAIAALGLLPTLIDWDSPIPGFNVLQEAASFAASILYDSLPGELTSAAAG